MILSPANNTSQQLTGKYFICCSHIKKKHILIKNIHLTKPYFNHSPRLFINPVVCLTLWFTISLSLNRPYIVVI